jgi:hypothetical protein
MRSSRLTATIEVVKAPADFVIDAFRACAMAPIEVSLSIVTPACPCEHALAAWDCPAYCVGPDGILCVLIAKASSVGDPAAVVQLAQAPNGFAFNATLSRRQAPAKMASGVLRPPCAGESAAIGRRRAGFGKRRLVVKAAQIIACRSGTRRWDQRHAGDEKKRPLV